MNYIFLTGLFPSEIISEIRKNTIGIQENAANNFQWNLINGFADNSIDCVSIINAPFVGSYPRLYRKPKVEQCKIKNRLTSDAISLSYINIRPFKSLEIKRKIIKKIDERLILEQQNVIVIYSANQAFIDAAIQIKHSCDNVSICIILPDLPIYMSAKTNLYYKLRGLHKQLLFKRRVNYIDSFVFLTEEMKNTISIYNKPYAIVEGMINEEQLNSQNKYDVNILLRDNEFVVFYAGSLLKKYGILSLIDAFKLLDDPKYKLWICGEGDAKNDIINYSRIDDRVKYWGQVDLEMIYKLQSQANLLINPRSARDEYTKYSFPSKTLEYLASGKPVLMNKLPGLPKDYYQYIFFYEETAKSLAEKIEQIRNLGKEFLLDFGQKAKEFVITNKRPSQQCEKIISMIIKN